ncbi:MAG: hypothetical protein ACLR0U_28225 [Enterocloster clostridioformis]
MYKHIPFYIRINEKTAYAISLFYHNSYDSVFDMGQGGFRLLGSVLLLSDGWGRY